MSLKLSDDSILQVAKLLQVAILTGTDVIDNLRLMRFEKSLDGESLVPTKEYTEQFNEGLERLLETAATLSEEGPSEEEAEAEEMTEEQKRLEAGEPTDADILKAVNEFVGNDPAFSASVLRKWMKEKKTV